MQPMQPMQPMPWKMPVKEVMTRDVAFIAPDNTIQSAAMVMQERDVGALPVRDGDQLFGMVTDRDIVVRSVALGQDPRTTPVRQVMTRGLFCCYEEQDVHEAAHLMESKQVRRLAVLDRMNRAVGIVSLGDLAIRTHDDLFAGTILEHVVEPAHPHVAHA
ncbi:MAG: CBS domain-containing protein [Chloroflexi bacterium]|nr:CBS domain-containing protein [Chloroflexota bacterium]